MRIAYLHGLESQSNPDDPKIQFLNQVVTAAWAQCTLAVFCQSIQDLIVCKSKFNRKKKHHED